LFVCGKNEHGQAAAEEAEHSESIKRLRLLSCHIPIRQFVILTESKSGDGLKSALRRPPIFTPTSYLQNHEMIVEPGVQFSAQ